MVSSNTIWTLYNAGNSLSWPFETSCTTHFIRIKTTVMPRMAVVAVYLFDSYPVHQRCVDSLKFYSQAMSICCSDHIDYTISRYRSRIRRAYDIVAAIYRTISCTNACLARAMLTYCSGGVCVWLMSLAVHTVRGSLCLTFPAVDLSCSALGACGGDWGTAVAPVVG